MSNLLACLVVFSIFLFLIFLQIVVRAKKPIKSAVISFFWGNIALTLVNIIYPFTNTQIPVSLLSIGISSILGIPGVTILLILNVIIKAY